MSFHMNWLRRHEQQRFGVLSGTTACTAASVAVGDQHQAKLRRVAGEEAKVNHRQPTHRHTGDIGRNAEVLLAQRGDGQSTDEVARTAIVEVLGDHEHVNVRRKHIRARQADLLAADVHHGITGVGAVFGEEES